MYKFLFGLLLSMVGQTFPMMENLCVYKNHSPHEKKEFYRILKRYFNSPSGKEKVLYPERGVFKMPSRKTYLLHAAIALDDVVKVRKILEKHGKRVTANFAYYEANTLNFALKCGNPSIVELVRSMGSKVVMLQSGRYFTLDTKQTSEQIKRLQELLFPINTSLKSLE